MEIVFLRDVYQTHEAMFDKLDSLGSEHTNEQMVFESMAIFQSEMFHVQGESFEDNFCHHHFVELSWEIFQALTSRSKAIIKNAPSQNLPNESFDKPDKMQNRQFPPKDVFHSKIRNYNKHKAD